MHLALALVHLAGARLLEVAHHVVEFVEQPLGFLGLAALVEFVDAVEHVVEIARRHGAEILRHLRHLVLPAVLLVALHLLGKFAHVAVHRLAQFLGQTRKLLLVRAALHGLLQTVLRGPELTLGVGEVAILQDDRELPQIIHHLEQPGIVARAPEFLGDEAQAQIGARFLHVFGRLDHQRVERRLHAPTVGDIKDQPAAHLDQRPGERLVEGALRQCHLARLGNALLAGIVARGQGHLHQSAGPGMFGEFERGLEVGLAADIARIGQGQPRRRDQRARARTGCLRDRAEGGLDRGDAVIIPRAVGDRELAALPRLRRLCHGDGGGAVGHHGYGHVAGRDPGAAEPDRAVARDDEAPLDALAQVGRRCLRFEPALRLDGGARRARHTHDDGGAGRRADDLAGAAEGQHDRRQASVARRIDPAVDAHLRRGRRRLAPVPGGGDAVRRIGAGHEEAGHGGEHGSRAQGPAVAPRHARRRRSHLQGVKLTLLAREMGFPQGAGEGVRLAHGQAVTQCAGRAMSRRGAAVETCERFRLARGAKPQKRPEGGKERQPEQDEASLPSLGPDLIPQAEP